MSTKRRLLDGLSPAMKRRADTASLSTSSFNATPSPGMRPDNVQEAIGFMRGRVIGWDWAFGEAALLEGAF